MVWTSARTTMCEPPALEPSPAPPAWSHEGSGLLTLVDIARALESNNITQLRKEDHTYAVLDKKKVFPGSRSSASIKATVDRAPPVPPYMGVAQKVLQPTDAVDGRTSGNAIVAPCKLKPVVRKRDHTYASKTLAKECPSCSNIKPVINSQSLPLVSSKRLPQRRSASEERKTTLRLNDKALMKPDHTYASHEHLLTIDSELDSRQFSVMTITNLQQYTFDASFNGPVSGSPRRSASEENLQAHNTAATTIASPILGQAVSDCVFPDIAGLMTRKATSEELIAVTEALAISATNQSTSVPNVCTSATLPRMKSKDKVLLSRSATVPLKPMIPIDIPQIVSPMSAGWLLQSLSQVASEESAIGKRDHSYARWNMKFPATFPIATEINSSTTSNIMQTLGLSPPSEGNMFYHRYEMNLNLCKRTTKISEDVVIMNQSPAPPALVAVNNTSACDSHVERMDTGDEIDDTIFSSETECVVPIPPGHHTYPVMRDENRGRPDHTYTSNLK